MITRILLTINLVVFALGAAATSGLALSSVNTKLYQWISHMFVHGGLMHIGVNVLTLFCFGELVERKLGGYRYLALYLFSGLAAALTFFYFTKPPFSIIGASGAIYGVMGAACAFYPRMRVLVIFYPFAPVKLCYLFPIALVYELTMALTRVTGNIGHWAHFGGAVFGFLMALAFKEMTETNRLPEDDWA